MVNELVISTLVLAYALLFTWAFRTLPQEGWQVLASVPKEKGQDGSWSGLNLTYYGLLSANGVAVAVVTVLVLMSALAVPLLETAVLLALLLGCCIPAARWVARAIESKANTFTIGGAVFVGVLVAPVVILLVNEMPSRDVRVDLPMLPTMAVLAIAYALGEGTGRLACISFGCCYGKPVAGVRRQLGKLFGTYHFAFAGPMKKVAYEGGLEGEPVIPIQGITAVLFVAAGLLGLVLFLKGHMLAAFLEPWLVTQLWRALSETMRADYRGGGAISVYQILAVLGACYGVAVTVALRREPVTLPDLAQGLQGLWHPAVLLLIQAVWVLIFLYIGRSKVTTSTISLFVRRDQV